MSPAIAQSAPFANRGNGTSVSFSLNLGTCNCGILNVWGAGDFFTGATCGGQAMVQLKKQVDLNGNAMVMYGLLNPPQGTQIFVVSRSSGGVVNAGLITLTGIDQHATFPNATGASQSSVGSSLSCSITTAALTDCAIIGYFFAGIGAGSISADTNAVFLDNTNIISNFYANAYYTPLASGSPGSKTITADEGNTGHEKDWILVSLAPQQNITFSLSDNVSMTEILNIKRGAVFSVLESLTMTEIKSIIRGAVFGILDAIISTDFFTSLVKWIRPNKSATSWIDRTKDSQQTTNQSKNNSNWTDNAKH